MFLMAAFNHRKLDVVCHPQESERKNIIVLLSAVET